MDYYPLFANLHGLSCLIVGGGEVAARKARELLAAGAHVTVNAPSCAPAMRELLAATPGMQLHPTAFDPELIGSQSLIISATSDPAVNREVAAAARNAGKFCNVVDDPAHSSFIVPAVIDRSPVMVAFSTGGTAPLLARLLRQRLEQWLPQRLGSLAHWAARWRSTARACLDQPEARRRFLEKILSGAAGKAVLGNDEAQADAIASDLLDAASQGVATGHAWLVGAGPGDPGLISVHGRRALEQADVVLHDRLIAPQLLAAARREAQIIDVGKAAGAPTKTQKEINELLIGHVRAGRLVCRLKAGDPFIFGRGGEEALALANEHLPFTIIPGITAASGCAAYAGIPLTHRSLSDGVTLVTASHAADQPEPDWERLAALRHTLVFYMGRRKIGRVAESLVRHGRSADTSAAVVCSGTTALQQVVTGTLADIADRCPGLAAGSPMLLLVGDTVPLAALLASNRTPDFPWSPPPLASTG